MFKIGILKFNLSILSGEVANTIASDDTNDRVASTNASDDQVANTELSNNESAHPQSQKFSDDWECQFEDWKNTNKQTNKEQVFVDKCLYAQKAGLMQCLLPMERVSICRGIQQYINDMKLLQSQKNENIVSANMSANMSANENAVETIVGLSQHMESVPTSGADSIEEPTAPVEASPAPIEGNYF